MKAFLILCVVALMVTVSAGDMVDFDYECGVSNSICKGPGDFYCGLDSSVKTSQCISGTICRVECTDVKPKDVDEKWQYASVSLAPIDKMVGVPIVITIVDSREKEGIVYSVEVYKGGGFKNAYVEGATNVGDSTLIASSFTLSDYRDGELIAEGSTDRSGVASFTPDAPGQYAIRTANNYYVFLVGDASGNVFECGDGTCDSSLGEDDDACPEDCTGATAPEIMPVDTAVCGDGICEGSENKISCPVDCELNSGEPEIPEPPEPPASECGNGICDSGELFSCPSDCVPEGGDSTEKPSTEQPSTEQPSGGIDMTLVIIGVVVIVLIGILAFLIKSGKIKMGGPKTPKPAAPAAPAQAAAPAPQPAAPAIKACTKCGTPIEPGNSFCMNCGTKI